MISEFLDLRNAGGRLSGYIDLSKRLGCPASGPDRLCWLQATSRLPGATWRSPEEPISACSGGDEWRDLKWEFLTGLALFAGRRLTVSLGGRLRSSKPTPYVDDGTKAGDLMGRLRE
jgi:hypothetical protein